MKLPDENKINFLVGVHVNFSQVLTGGVVAMHKLAHNLAKTGHNVFTFCEPEFPHENIKVINSVGNRLNDLETEWSWETFHYPLNKTVSIYPQIIRGNPYNTKYVSRWILYHTEKPIEDLYGENDQIMVVEKGFVIWHIKIHHPMVMKLSRPLTHST